MAKVSLASQIAAVEAMANGNFAALSNPRTRGLQEEHLRAAAQTLRFVQHNEAAIRALSMSKKAGAA